MTLDKNLIQRLHNARTIDKRHVLWWQLGYEGRSILTPKEFERGLKKEIWKLVADPKTQKPIRPTETEMNIWKEDNVPILLKDIQFGEEILPCFISVRPESHAFRRWNEEDKTKFNHIPSVYDEPHVRGLVIEKKDKFLFWYPFLFGEHPAHYGTEGLFLERENLWCLQCPIYPTKFYKNMIEYGWSRGRRAQKKSQHYELSSEGFNLVPYFDFNTEKKHVMIYPVQLIKKELDFPVIIKSIPDEKKVEVMGVGYPYFPSDIYYWELTKTKKEIVRNSIKVSLGLEALI